jgi:hypothetical protein
MGKVLAVVLILHALALVAPGAIAQPPLWQNGDYQLVRANGRTGTLTIHSASRHQATFSMDVTACMHSCGTDAAVNHVAGIERGMIEVRGSRGVFAASGPDENSKSPDLGVCKLAFVRRSTNTISVVQSGECWWFGQGVDVSGTYGLVR